MTKKDDKATEESTVEKSMMENYVEMMGTMPGVDKGGYNPMYKSNYITLDDILKVTRPHLLKFGFFLKQTINKREGGDVILESTLYYKDGTVTHISTTVLPDVSGAKNPAQALGSLITYHRRYHICAGLGLSVDPDDDGNAVDGAGKGAAGTKAPAGNQASSTKKEVPIAERKGKLKSALASLFGNDIPSKFFEDLDKASTEDDLKKIYAEAQEVAKAAEAYSQADGNS